jgi:hypothetical protein
MPVKFMPCNDAGYFYSKKSPYYKTAKEVLKHAIKFKNYLIYKN